MTTLPEERVLRSLDPVPKDVNEWPDFALRDVKIFYQGKARYADLFEASIETPLCVVGELMPLDEEQDELALIDNTTHIRIKIENVTHYSFGQDDSGQPVIWAAGRAGWYEITPSDRYVQHYMDTIEAIDLFYFMVDQHQKLPRKRHRTGFQIDPFLVEYQKHTDYRIDDDDEAMETIHKHHKFLLRQMVEEREGIDWSHTHLWKHLTETYVDEVESLQVAHAQAITNGAASEVDSSASESDAESDSASESESADSSVEQDENQPSSEDTTESSEETSDDKSEIASDSDTKTEEDMEVEDTTDWTKPIWDLLNILRKQANFDMRTCGVGRLATEILKTGWFPGNHKAALAAIERSAESLVRLMNEARLRKKFNWSTRNIYAELEATLADEIAADIMKTPLNKGGKQKHRMKSVLRPSGAGKASKRARNTNDSIDDDEEMADSSTTLPAAKRQTAIPRHLKEQSVDSTTSRGDSPSRQLNGHFDPYALPELPPGPEAQEMLDLVAREAKRVGRQHQTSHLEAFLGQHLI